ncbi:unnamed protein product [Schistocephalus solidus]|uniref:Endo/exonuclease/phosphatase domain-containing protein n=1 Tax=Schistocephalus solidus TaxID=70667 RepID=A0A183T6G7_SCHSO|nr:unnamed protein product [Schistocephalus solidus]
MWPLGRAQLQGATSENWVPVRGGHRRIHHLHETNGVTKCYLCGATPISFHGNMSLPVLSPDPDPVAEEHVRIAKRSRNEHGESSRSSGSLNSINPDLLLNEGAKQIISLLPKLDELKIYLCQTLSDIISITESWLTTKVDDREVAIRTPGSQPLEILTVYQPPRNDPQTDSSLIDDLEAFASRSEVMIMGDFNAPNIDWTLSSAPGSELNFDRRLLEAIHKRFLTQHVLSPTRIREG